MAQTPHYEAVSMIIGAPAASSVPLWQALLIGAIGSIAGGLFTLFGSWLSQRSTATREDARWKRESEKADIEGKRKLYVDVAESVENSREWLKAVAYGREPALATMQVHPNQLTGRIKLSRSWTLSAVWDDYRAKVYRVSRDLELGNVRPNGLGGVELEDDMRVPVAIIGGDIVQIILAQLHADPERNFTFEELRAAAVGLKLRYGLNERLLRGISLWISDTLEAGQLGGVEP